MIGAEEIVRRIPHRYPILLLDRVLDVVPGRSLTALKAVTCAEPCYQRRAGRPPVGDFRYPVTLLLESWAQAAVVLATWDQPNPDVLGGKVELAGVIKDVEFHRPVYPGDVLRHHVTMVKELGETTIIEGGTTVDGGTVQEVGQFVLAMRDLAEVLPAAEPQPL